MYVRGYFQGSENGRVVTIEIFWSWIFQKLLTRSHTLLLHKLHYYGIPGELNSWIQNFLSNRKQAVVLEGDKSDYVAVE